LRRRLAGVDKFRARPFGQIRIDERQLRTERLDRESVPGEAAHDEVSHFCRVRETPRPRARPEVASGIE
jgi:hypothetical protein